jgi:hypothetical protein
MKGSEGGARVHVQGCMGGRREDGAGWYPCEGAWEAEGKAERDSTRPRMCEWKAVSIVVVCTCMRRGADELLVSHACQGVRWTLEV